MRWIFLNLLALTVGPMQTQGHLATYRTYHSPPSDRVEFTTPLAPPSTILSYQRHIQYLTTTRRHLEAVATQLSLEVRKLRRHATEELQEPWSQDKCACESADLSSPTPTPAEPANEPPPDNSAKHSSWRLEMPEPTTGSTSNEANSDTSSGSFLTSTIFVLAVFLMGIPVACVVGFVILGRRRRRRQHTHA